MRWPGDLAAGAVGVAAVVGYTILKLHGYVAPYLVVMGIGSLVVLWFRAS